MLQDKFFDWKKEFFHPTCILGPRNGFCSHHRWVLVKLRTGDVCSSYERTGHGLAQTWLPDILLVTSWCKQAEQYINFTGEQVVHALSLRSGHASNEQACSNHPERWVPFCKWFGDFFFVLATTGHICSLCSYSEVVHEKPRFKFLFSLI